MNRAIIAEDNRMDKHALTIQNAYKNFKTKQKFLKNAMKNMKFLHEIKMKEMEKLKAELDIENKKIKNVSQFLLITRFFYCF